jgi:signal transduction histidine kinase
VINTFNQCAAELWGRMPKPGDTDERFCGSYKLFRPDGSFMPHEQCPMADVVAGRITEVRDQEVLIERPDGSRIAVVVNIRPLTNERGKVTGAINCFYDITGRKRAEDALKQRQAMLESEIEERTAELSQLSRRLMHIQDEEGRKIARELHDSLGQYLIGLKINLAVLHDHVSKEKADTLTESLDLVGKCITETRTISYLLHPPLLDENGLGSAAQMYVEGFAKRSGIDANLQIDSAIEGLPSALEIVLFRVLQEGLTNVHRHSKSPKVDIRLGVYGDAVTLEMRDYGKGIPSEQLKHFQSRRSGGGVGLAGMRERLSDVGGELRLTLENPGTALKATIPKVTTD